MVNIEMQPDRGKSKEIGLVELTNKARQNLQDFANLMRATFRRLEDKNKPDIPQPTSDCPPNPLDDIANQLNAMSNLVSEMRQFFNENIVSKL